MEKNNIEKPITLVIEETRQELINTINKSALPIFILEPMIKDIYGEINLALKTQTEKDRQTYNEALDKERRES